MGGVGFQTKLFSNTSWVSYSSTQFWHWLPGDSTIASDSTDEGLSPVKLPLHHLATDCKSKFVAWSTSLDGYRSEVPTILSLGAINLVEWLTELRERYYWLDHCFIMKEYNSRTTRWERSMGQDTGKGVELPCPLQAHHSPQILLGSTTWKLVNPVLLDFYGGSITCA